MKKEFIKILIRTEPLKTDIKNSNLVCQTKDGTFHEVMSLAACMVKKTPPGWKVILAVRRTVENRVAELLVEYEKNDA